jgi:hypothetical protein
MRKVVFGIGISLMLMQNGFSKSNDEVLLDYFHKYGITKCDNFILKNSRLKANWNFFISQHRNELGKNVKEVSIITIYGSKNDTVKIDDSYIQAPNGCFLTTRSTLTFTGSCEDNHDKNYWYISTRMPNKDYTTYKNAGGIERHCKEISMGNFKASVLEAIARSNAPLEK